MHVHKHTCLSDLVSENTGTSSQGTSTDDCACSHFGVYFDCWNPAMNLRADLIYKV